MKTIRYVAVAATALMSLMNLPAGFIGSDMPAAAAWLGSLLGALGLACAIALLRRAEWAAPATVAVGLLNVAAGAAAVASHWQGGPIGIVIGTAITAAAAACLAADRRHRARTA